MISRWVLALACASFGLAGCSSPPPAPPAPPVDSSPAIVEPAEAPSLEDPWGPAEGWHRLATIPALQRRPRALAASRTRPAVAVLGERGRRVMLVSEGANPLPLLLPQDVMAVDLAFEEGVEAPVLVLACPRDGVLLRVLPLPGDAVEVGREPLGAGHIRLLSTPSGGAESLDALLRPDPAEPAVRGVAGWRGRYRGTEQGGMPAVVRSEPGGRQVAVLARIPLAQDVVTLGMDRSPQEAPAPEKGWLAAWTGKDEARQLHFVRFDGMGRVLVTTPAPDGEVPGAFDLRAAVLGDKELVYAAAGKDGAELWRYVPPPDGTRLEVRFPQP